VLHRPDAREDGAGARPPRVSVASRGLARDPLALAVRERGAPVETRRDLHPRPGPSARHARDETDVQLARRFLHETLLDADAGRAQLREARARDLRIRVLHGGDDAGDAGRDHRVGARRRAPVVAAGLEVDVERGPARPRARLRERERLGVREARLLVPAFAHHRAVLDDDAADPRVRGGRIQPEAGQLERPTHEAEVGGVGHNFGARRALALPGRFTSWIASRKSSNRWKSSYTEAKRM